MFPDPKAHASAQAYYRTGVPLTRLGWGISGQVFLSPNKLTVVKVHNTHEKYLAELDVYRHLRKKRLTSVHGFVIPSLRGNSDADNIIEMDHVVAPFLVDFAGAQFDEPDWSIEDWQEDIEFKFGVNAFLAFWVYEELKKHGVYYVDFRQSNLNIQDHPERKPDPPDDEIDK